MLKDKVIVIIGGTTGLGRAAALAVTAAGASVVVVGLDDPAAGETSDLLGERGRVITGDATDPATADAAIDMAATTWGQLDGLYHVAGGSARAQGDGPLHELTDTGWERAISLNLTSTMYANRAATRWLLEHERPGSILNMSSVLSFSPAARDFATHGYAAAKAAVNGFTQACAARYAANNIRFNAIAPGLVATPMARRAAEDPRIMDYVRTKQPLDGGRIGVPGDLDAAVVFFLSDQAHFVTGQVLAVDGGWSVSDGQYPAST